MTRFTFERPARVTIVGGGITGLAAGWYLERESEAAGIPLDYTILECGNRWGGKILTERIETTGGTFLVEAGPDSFLTQKPWALELARELGLADRLQGTNDDQRQVFVVREGRPVPLPDGVLLIVPTRFAPFALSPLISLRGKLRMGLDLLIPPRRDAADETLADFVTRRLGSEALDRIAEPLLSGIYNADAERQSILATFPQFRTLEKEHGSLIRGMLMARRGRQPAAQSGSRPLSVFATLRGGTGELTDVLAARLRGDLRLNAAVQMVSRLEGGYTVTLETGERLDTDALILTVPAFVAADLIRPLAVDAARGLESIRYVSTGTISLAFREADVRRPLRGFGLVVPRSERRPINAITLSSTKFDERAPAGYVLLRVFFGGSRSPASMALDDDELLRAVRDELRTFLGINVPPLFHRIYRWPRANPQYDVGHLNLIDRIEGFLPDGVALAGSAYRGAGMPDCVHQARLAARRAVELALASASH